MADEATTVASVLAGRKLYGLRRHEHHWSFEFGNSVVLSAECPWRILCNGIAFTDSDHGQQFGRPAPLEAEREVMRLLSDRPVEHADLRERTGDLSVEFSGGVTLELLNLSGGYEAWQLSSPGTGVVAQGGGKVIVYSQAPL